jgi:hypothetical protein
LALRAHHSIETASWTFSVLKRVLTEAPGEVERRTAELCVWGVDIPMAELVFEAAAENGKDGQAEDNGVVLVVVLP